MLCDCVTRGCGDHSPLTTAATLEWRRRSAWGRAVAARRGTFEYLCVRNVRHLVPALGQQSTFRVRIHRPWHRHFGPTVGHKGSYAKCGIQAGEARSGVPTEGPLAQKLRLLFRKATESTFEYGMFAIWYQPMSTFERVGRTSWCLLFVLIRHGIRGGSGPQRLIRAFGKETGNPIMAFHRPSFFPLRSLIKSLSACLSRSFL
jgi:hypothetical protein